MIKLFEVQKKHYQVYKIFLLGLVFSRISYREVDDNFAAAMEAVNALPHRIPYPDSHS